MDGGNITPEQLEQITREVKGFGTNVKELQDSMSRDLAAVRKLAEDTKGAIGPEVKAQLDVLAASVAEKQATLESAVKAVGDHADDIEKKVNRPRLGASVDESVAEHKGIRDFHRTALAARGELKIGTDLSDEKVPVDEIKSYIGNFPLYLRRDIHPQGAEAKAMSVGSDPDGGYWVVPVVSARILSIVRESSPLRELATVENISTDAIEFPIDDDEAGADWVGETESRPATSTPQVGVQRIPVHEMYAFPMVTQKLLEDASVDVEAWLGRKIGEKFGRLEATAFVSGNGVKKPRGFLTYPNGTTRGNIEQIASGNANTLTSDGLINLIMSIKEPYSANAAFLMRRAAVGAVVLFKDGNGQYIWRPGLEMGKPSSLLGYPIREAADMPAVTAGALAVAFGDWARAYTIVDRLGITTLRDPYTAKPFVGFYTRKRVGGDVTNFEAIKLGVVSA